MENKEENEYTCQCGKIFHPFRDKKGDIYKDILKHISEDKWEWLSFLHEYEKIKNKKIDIRLDSSGLDQYVKLDYPKDKSKWKWI